MKTYEQAKQAYTAHHLSKPLKSPEIRLGALRTIEASIRKNKPEWLSGNTLFVESDRFRFQDLYLKWKGYDLNSAEKSVIKGLFDFSH